MRSICFVALNMVHLQVLSALDIRSLWCKRICGTLPRWMRQQQSATNLMKSLKRQSRRAPLVRYSIQQSLPSAKDKAFKRACNQRVLTCNDWWSMNGRESWALDWIQGSVLSTMWRSHARTFIMIGCIKLFDNVLTFASPLLLQQLLLSLQEGKPAGMQFSMNACSSKNPTLVEAPSVNALIALPERILQDAVVFWMFDLLLKDEQYGSLPWLHSRGCHLQNLLSKSALREVKFKRLTHWGRLQ